MNTCTKRLLCSRSPPVRPSSASSLPRFTRRAHTRLRPPNTNPAESKAQGAARSKPTAPRQSPQSEANARSSEQPSPATPQGSKRLLRAIQLTVLDIQALIRSYLGLLLPSAVIVHFIAKNLFIIHGAFGASMLPTFYFNGEWFITSTWHAQGRGVKVGDVVCAKNPLRAGYESVLKRVLGLEGDLVWVPFEHGLGGRMVRVPKGHVWLAGDNMSFSRDSRHYGAVPMNLIIGKLVWRLLPLRHFGPLPDGLVDVDERLLVGGI